MPFPEVRESQELVDRLRARITPAALRGRPENDVIVLAERQDVRLAVHLARRRHDHRFPLLGRHLENELRPLDVGFDRLHRTLDDEPDPDGGGEMEDDVGVVDELRHDGAVLDRVDRVRESRLGFEVLDVFHPPRGEIVDDRDVVAALEQRVREMRSDETGPARD